MLLKLEKLIAKYGMKITGVIQAGAHEGEELELFDALGIKTGHLFEPCISYSKLVRNMKAGYSAYNYGLGQYNGNISMFCTGFNNGQSNSMLKPKQHINQYPEIVFDKSYYTQIKKLDWFGITSCNFLMMDVQGYELEVLKGATETLKHIDYIYTEVNMEEMYEGCALLPDLDNYLTDFQRVETKLARCKAWGDALYIRKTLL